ncbi:hypothetical protein BDL97_13G028500 [Sphagnum fallax]|nr:hypothetical protein BDL97_13G028500 [Sphagnum fallax]
MAVQAQYPSSILLPDYHNRARQMFGADNGRVFLSPLTVNHSSSSVLPEDFQIQPMATQNGFTSHAVRMFNQLAGPSNLVSSQQPSLNVAAVLINERENDHLACSTLLPGSRKRARELGDDDDENALVATTHRQRQQQQPILNAAPAEYHHQQQQQQQTLVHRSPGAAAMSPGPQTIGVSTGLRLAFEQDDSSRLNSTTSASTSTERRAEARTSQSLFYAVGEDLNIQLQQQREEIEQFFKVQGEQLRQLLEEKRQRHSQALVAAVEEGVSWQLREKEMELEKMRRQNSQLAEHVKQVSLEAHRWENKARTYQVMTTALRSNLQQAQQQAVALSLREQSKEGCGDSQADDAASSSHHGDKVVIRDDDDAHARTCKENRELREQRCCRVCRCNDVSILLLPCRHLCLCKECESRLDACPLCRCLKNASVQVYMS